MSDRSANPNAIANDGRDRDNYRSSDNSPSTPTTPKLTRETPTVDGRPIPDDLIEAARPVVADVARDGGQRTTDEPEIFAVYPPRWERSEMIRNLGGPSYRLLFWSPTDVGFEHRCDRGERGVIICAPRLQIGNGHTITWSTALDGRQVPTVRASVLCPDCGTHGFIT